MSSKKKCAVSAVVRRPMKKETAPVATDPRKFQIDRRAAHTADWIESQGAPDDLLFTTAVADAIGVSRPWLEVGRSNCPSGRYGPEFVHVGNMIAYRRDALVAWLRQRAEIFEKGRPKKIETVTGKLIVGK